MGFLDRFKKKAPVSTESDSSKKSGFLGFILLSDCHFDWQLLLDTAWEDWELKLNMEIKQRDEADNPSDSQVASCDNGCWIPLMLLDMPVPDQEAEYNAVHNYMWKDAVETAKSHKAHLILSVLGGQDPKEAGKLFVKVAASCCKQENVIGIYTSGVVFEPRFYMEAAQMAKGDSLPILNWIWFGIRQSDKGISVYTFGMESFGKDEMEVLDVTDAKPSEVRDFLLNIVVYVLEGDVTLRHGETLGATAEQQLAITRSPGVFLEGMTLKIEYGAPQ